MANQGDGKEENETGMKPRARKIIWGGGAVVAFVITILVFRLLPGAGDDLAIGMARFLSRQSCDGVAAELEIEPTNLQLRGVVRATVTHTDEESLEEIRFVLHPALVVQRVEVNGVEFQEQRGWSHNLFADPANLRRFVLSDAQQHRTIPSTAEVKIEFRGSAVGFRHEQDDVLPVTLPADGHYLPAVVFATPPLSLRVSVPTEWKILSDAPLTGAVLEEQKTRSIEAWTPPHSGTELPTVILGPLHVEEKELNGHQLTLVTPIGQRVSAPLLEEALAYVETVFPRALPQQVTFLFTAPTGTAPTAVGDRVWYASQPTEEHELVRCLTAAALEHSVAGDRREWAGVPEAVGLQSVPWDDDDRRARVRAQFRAEGRPDPRLEGWLALEYLDDRQFVTDELGAWSASVDEQGNPTRPLVEDPTAQAFLRWCTRAGEVDLSFRQVEVISPGFPAQLRVELQVHPRPPADLELPPVEILLVGDRRYSRTVCDLGRTGKVEQTLQLNDSPVRIVLDPGARFPDSVRKNNTYVFEPEPRAFAVTPDSEALALAFAQHWGDSYGVSLFDLGGDEPVQPDDWFEFSGEISALDWVTPERFLVLDLLRASQREKGLLDLRDGRLRWFDENVAPGRLTILQNEEQAPGRYRHSLYWIETRRDVPFGNEYAGPLGWVQGAEELLVRDHQGQAIVMNLQGETRAELSRFASEISEVRHTELGYTFVTESATGSQLHLLNAPEATTLLFDGPGRLQDYFLSADSGFFYVFVRISEQDHRVFAVRPRMAPRPLYTGEDRPLAYLHSPKGAVLVQENGGQDGALATAGLVFFSYPSEREEPNPDALHDVLCASAFLNPPPRLASAGRYLYYVRPEEEPADVSPIHRRRALCRYDFLTGNEEVLFPHGAEKVKEGAGERERWRGRNVNQGEHGA